MPDNPMQTAMQPFIKLVQGNMELLAKFSGSPQAMAEASTTLQGLFQQSQDSTARMMQSNAMAQLAQGMLKNYTEFLVEVGQTSMSAVSQAQAAMLRQTQDATTKVAEATRRTVR